MSFLIAYHRESSKKVILNSNWVVSGKIEKNKVIFSYYNKNLSVSAPEKPVYSADFTEGKDGLFKFIIHGCYGKFFVFKLREKHF